MVWWEKNDISSADKDTLDNEGIYPVSGLHGINTSQINPADENISFIWSTLACIDV
jgi:hypothetical protein